MPADPVPQPLHCEVDGRSTDPSPPIVLRIPTPDFRILRTCVQGRMTNAEETGMAVLDSFFPGQQFETVIHASTKVWNCNPNLNKFYRDIPASLNSTGLI